MPDSVVRVLPDVPAIDRAFDYLVPEHLGDQVRVGTMVRVPLSGRRVAGWVLEVGVVPDPSVRLSPVSKVVGHGPSPEMVDLCRWAAWRWAGRLATMLRLASPDRVVASVPPPRVRCATKVPDRPVGALALDRGPGAHVVEVAPTTDPLEVALAAASRGQAIVVVPQREVADRVARGLRSSWCCGGELAPRLGCGCGRRDGGRWPGGGLRPGPGAVGDRGDRRARRDAPERVLAHLARPRGRDRTRPTCRRAVSARLAMPLAGGAGGAAGGRRRRAVGTPRSRCAGSSDGGAARAGRAGVQRDPAQRVGAADGDRPSR